MTETSSQLGHHLAPTRQSPLGILLIGAHFFLEGRSFNLVILLFIFLTRRSAGDLIFLALALVLLLAYSTLRWWRFTFEVADGELLVKKGVVSIERLAIPLNRIQSVSVEQQLLHRLLGVVKLEIDTAGSTEVEFRIDALQRDRAAALEKILSESRQDQVLQKGESALNANTPSHEPVAGPKPLVEQELIRRTPAELVRIALSRLPWAGLAGIPAGLIVFGGLLEDAGVAGPETGDNFGDVANPDTVSGFFESGVSARLVAVVAGGLIGLLFIGWLLQIAQEFFRSWGLNIALSGPVAEGSDLVSARTIDTLLTRRSGLATKVSKASSLGRIQSIKTSQTILQRLFGLSDTRLSVIGQGDLAVPGTRSDELSRLRELVFGNTAPPQTTSHVSKQLIFFEVRNVAVLMGIVAVGGWVATSQPGFLAALILVPITFLTARRRWRLLRWGLESYVETGDDTNKADSDEFAQNTFRLCLSEQFLTLTTNEIMLRKAQVVTVRQSFFERRRGLATLKVGVAADSFHIRFIPLPVAEQLRDVALYAAESSNRRWM